MSYSLEFRGHATPVEPGVLLTRASAPHALFDRDDEALLEGRVSLVSDCAFELAATISFGNGTAVRLRSLGRGSIVPAAEAGLRLGSALCAIDGGSGRLATASGHVATSFVVSDTGELTDHQLGLVVVAEERPTSTAATTHVERP
jgi:hypothetical protein